jgi:hypothetical protein
MPVEMERGFCFGLLERKASVRRDMDGLVSGVFLCEMTMYVKKLGMPSVPFHHHVKRVQVLYICDLSVCVYFISVRGIIAINTVG